MTPVLYNCFYITAKGWVHQGTSRFTKLFFFKAQHFAYFKALYSTNVFPYLAKTKYKIKRDYDPEHVHNMTPACEDILP